MEPSPALRSEGKRSYVLDDLRKISYGDLKHRLELIDNDVAREIAARLLKALDTQFTNQYGQLMLKDSHSLAQMAGMFGKALLNRIDELRRLDFGDIIAEGPGRLDEYLESLHPFVRFLQPPAKVRKPQDSAERLLRYLDFYENPQQSVPESFRRSWIFAGGMFCALVVPVSVIIMFKDSVDNKAFLMLGNLAFLMACIVLAVVQLAGFGKLRIMSLYISFTDEFMLETAEAEAGEEKPAGPQISD